MGTIGAHCGGRGSSCSCLDDSGTLQPPGPCQTACEATGGVYSFCPSPGSGGPASCSCEPRANAPVAATTCSAYITRKDLTVGKQVAQVKNFTYQICTAKEASFSADMTQYLDDHNVSATVLRDVCSKDGTTDVCSQYMGLWYSELQKNCPEELRKDDSDWNIASVVLNCPKRKAQYEFATPNNKVCSSSSCNTTSHRCTKCCADCGLPSRPDCNRGCKYCAWC